MSSKMKYVYRINLNPSNFLLVSHVYLYVIRSYRMSLPIVISNRLIKFVGVIVKALSYVFHFLFPKKRFTIPKQSDPLRPSILPSRVPKIIWQTNYTNEVSLPVYVNYLFNRLISPDHEYRYVSTEERLSFIKEHAPQRVSSAFEQLTDGAAQADLWRVFVLNYYGGVYMDIDAHAVWPISKMIDPDAKELFLLTKKHYSNYFIASQKDNPILSRAIDIMVDNIEQKRIEHGVYALTGPIVLNTAIGDEKVNSRLYRITCNQGSFTNEYFQYIDKPRGKWIHADRKTLLKDNKDTK